MEWKTYKDSAAAAAAVCDVKSELPVETEILIPDYLPPVFKVVKCFADLVVVQAVTTAARLTAEGYLRVSLWYQTEDGQLCTAETKMPFSRQAELPAEGVLHPDAVVTGETEYINCRAVNERRLEVRGAFAVYITVYAEEETEVITALEGDGVYRRSAEISCERCAAVSEKLITAEEDVTFDVPPEAVLSIDCAGMVEEAKLLSGKAVLKGTVYARITYRGADSGALLSAEKSVPFREILDAPGADESCSCFAVAQPSGASLAAAADESSYTLSVTASLKARVYRPVQLTCVTDAFCTTHEMELTSREVTFEEPEDMFVRQTEAVASGKLPDASVEIVGAFAQALVPELAETETGSCLRGRCLVHILCRNERGEIDCLDKACEYTLPLSAAGKTQRSVRAWACVRSVSARKAGDEASAAVLVEVSARVARRRRMQVLTQAAQGEELRRRTDAAVVVCYADKGEDVFDVAKHYASSPEAIAAANDVGEGVLDAPARLLIPPQA